MINDIKSASESVSDYKSTISGEKIQNFALHTTMQSIYGFVEDKGKNGPCYTRVVRRCRTGITSVSEI